MTCARHRAVALAAALLATSCASHALFEASSGASGEAAFPRYEPTRADYVAFRARHPGGIEPNYLPFMLHPVVLDGRVLLVVCRWADARFPLPVYVQAPAISRELQDEFHPQSPATYVEAVERALDGWERGLEGLVRFRRVARAADAALRVRLIGEVAPTPGPEIKVLGATSMRDACRAAGGDPAAERIEVEYDIPEVRIFVADEFGLLTSDQVERVALHELGHALGMRGHSRRPADLMYEAVRERSLFTEPSTQDLNSFLTLYRLPNGTVYTRAPWGAEVAAEGPRPTERAPVLAIAPHVDARHGYELRPPEGWMRIETPTGMVAVDGVSWDFEATFEVIVRNYPTIESYLERHGAEHLANSWVVRRDERQVAGHRALRLALRRPRSALAEDLILIESGDGRLFIVIADCAISAYDAYRPWFDAALASLEIRKPTSPRASDGSEDVPFFPVPGP